MWELILEHRIIVCLLVFLLFSQMIAVYYYYLLRRDNEGYFLISWHIIFFWPSAIFDNRLKVLVAVLFSVYTMMFIYFFANYYFLWPACQAIFVYFGVCLLWLAGDILVGSLVDANNLPN